MKLLIYLIIIVLISFNSVALIDSVIDYSILQKNFNTTNISIIKNEIFLSLSLNDAEKKEAVMTIDNAGIINNTNFSLDFVFNEVCGRIINYTLVNPKICHFNQCYEVPTNKSNRTTTTCISYDYECDEEVKDFNGIKEYKIKANIESSNCIINNTRYSYAIDWKPRIKIGQNYLIKDDWAWWNSTTMTNINCTNNEWISLNNGSSLTGIDKNGRLRLGYASESRLLNYFNPANTFLDEKCVRNAVASNALFNSTGKLSSESYIFDGNNDYVSFGADAITIFGNESLRMINLWVYPYVNTTANAGWGLFSDGSSAAAYDYRQMILISVTAGWCGDTQPRFFTQSHYGMGCSSPFPMTINAWSMYTFVINKTYIYYYVNGVGYGTGNISDLVASETNFFFSNFYSNGGASTRAWNGKAADISFYNMSGMTLAQINSTINYLYNSGNGLKYNTSANIFYSDVNDTVGSYSTFNMTLNASDNSEYIKFSADNTTYTEWLSMANNSQSLSMNTAGRYISFIINLTGNSSYSGYVLNLSIINITSGTPPASECEYGGSGDFNITDTTCNITSTYTVSAGSIFNIINSTVWIRNVTINANNKKFISGTIHIVGY